jgi:hypothetical protein
VIPSENGCCPACGSPTNTPNDSFKRLKIEEALALSIEMYDRGRSIFYIKSEFLDKNYDQSVADIVAEKLNGRASRVTMDTKSAFRAMFKILIHPNAVLRQLPANKVIKTGFIIPLVIGLERGIRNGSIRSLGILPLILLVLFAFVVLYPIIIVIIQLIMKMFRRRITFAACMNVLNYSQAPSFVTKIALWGISIGSIFSDALTFFFLLLGFVSIAYSIYILVVGLKMKSY